MGKKLLSSDYDKIIGKTFKMPESDYPNYYSNIVDEYYGDNPDIIESLRTIIREKITWYETRVRIMGVDQEDFSQLDFELTKVPLLHGYDRDVDRSYFDNQLKILDDLQQNIDKQKSPFSILEWTTIYYYAKETSLLPDFDTNKEGIEKFMKNHRITTTYEYFKNKYYDAQKRINKKKDYPIDKLKKIIPFLKDNYKQVVTRVEEDISFLESENADF